MSNSIRRARGRPRRKSVNFRTLWWLVRLEALHGWRCNLARATGAPAYSRASTLAYQRARGRVSWRVRAERFTGQTI